MQLKKKRQGEHHLQCEDAHDGFMVTDAVLHVAGVSVLHDFERKFIKRLVELLLLFIFIIIIIMLFIWILRWRFGIHPPQDPIAPRRFPFLPAGEEKSVRCEDLC